MKKRKLMLIIGIFLLGISTVYAVTIIRAADVTYDTSKSNGSSSNVQGAIDELYSLSDGSCSSGSSSSTRITNLVDYIINLAKKDTTNLAYDDTEDKNLRYIGSNPNNYVEFNGELWRIIGVMNNVKDETGKNESRVKLIRAESIGNYSWDNKIGGNGTSTSNNGSNDWVDARLMTLLNSGPYWNRTSGTCYDGKNNGTKSCDFRNTGLTLEAKSMISKALWNLGGYSTYETPSSSYKYERGTKVYDGRPTTWQGNVGLIYPSDYGFSVGGDVRGRCLTTKMSEYNTSMCHTNNWLYINETSQWTITPYSDLNYSAFSVVSAGTSGGSGVLNSYAVRPVVYLNTNINRVSGKGTIEDPYVITDRVINVSDSSNASHPKLDEDGKLIPVTLANDGKVTMVSEEDEEWYNYGGKKWANAVILIDSPSKTYKEGDIISESDIESYFVWIPKYKYKLWNIGTTNKKAHEIDIIFDTKDTKDEEGVSCKTPMTSGATGNCNNGEYMTHPAFISLGVDGFWVGKFETGYKGASSTEAAQVNSSDSSKIIIKPNVYSWRNNTVYNFFTSAYNYERSLDSHMMKNTEWGAVAYLSHSQYGSGYEVNINNNSSFKTGYSSLLTIDQHSNPGTYGDGNDYNHPYNTEIGYLASTTGNITGVYDTSGGAHEYMASYIDGNYGSSGFDSNALAKYNARYYDVYSSKSNTTSYNLRILGDATGEMGPFSSYLNEDGGSMWHSNWYADAAYFVDSDNPWFRRGAYYGDGDIAGLFCFSWYTGLSFNRLGSRLVLSP